MNNVKKSRLNSQTTRGFTLIELILYVALVAIFITSAVLFSLDLIYGREKSHQQQIVQQNVRIALGRITYEIERANDIQSVNSNQIVLDNGGGSTTTIELSGENVQITTGGQGPYNLTSNQVSVDALNFGEFSSPTNDSKNINVSSSLRQVQAAVSGQLTAQTSAQVGIELKGQFSQSRRLLVDLTNLNLVSGSTIEGIAIQNSGAIDIIIDKLLVSWSGTGGGENITEVQIGGGGVEWTGSQGSGTTVELNDFTLSPAAGSVDINNFTFDSDMSGANLEVHYMMGDQSRVITEFSLAAGGTPTTTPTQTPSPTLTPTPTPSPTPAPSCTTVCQSNGYSQGTCRASNQACINNGEVRVSAGNQYCTGGPTADTCCCK